MLAPSFEYILPVIRGIQAGREYYVSMFPVRLLPKIFPLETEEILPELRASRVINKNRIPKIAKYILDNPKNYTFTAISASIDADIIFEPIGTDAEERKIGRLRVPMDAKFTINDGGHRRAAFELALKENPDLGYETVAVILFLDIGLERSQQICNDLNSYAVQLEPSLSILYEYRDKIAKIVREVIKEVQVFSQLTDKSNSILSSRSSKLFTLGNIYDANLDLFANSKDKLQQQIEIAISYWNTVSSYIPDWQQVLQRQVSASEIRREYLHCHSIALTALGRVGESLITNYPDNWQELAPKLLKINWIRSNPDWEGCIMVRGEISKSRNSIIFLSGYIKSVLGLPLTVEEEKLVKEKIKEKVKNYRGDRLGVDISVSG